MTVKRPAAKGSVRKPHVTGKTVKKPAAKGAVRKPVQ